MRPSSRKRFGVRVVLGVVLALMLAHASRVVSQAPPPRSSTEAPTASKRFEAPPNMVPQANTPAEASALWKSDPLFIDLPTALRLAQSTNLEIAQSQQIVVQAQAAQERARVLMLPTLGLGSVFVDHEGRIQQAVGNILNMNRNSLFVGGGPSATFQFADAIFAPLATRQLVAASQAGVTRVTNDTLLIVAEAYFNIMRSRRRIAALQETLEQLNSDRPSPVRGKSRGLFQVVRDIVEVGGKDAFRSDLERVRVEIFRRQQELEVSLQDYRVSMAELARVLYLDPTTPMWPIEDFRVPISLPGDSWMTFDLEQLVLFALNNRPELAENQALIEAAVNRLRTARLRPLLPSVVLNYSYGGFGGSPNFVNKLPNSGLGVGPALTQSGRIDDFGQRGDFDVALIWRLQNMGFGNQAEIREQRSLQTQAQLRLQQTQERVMAQVVQAKEQVDRSRERMDIVRSSLFDSPRPGDAPAYLSLRLNFERIRGAESRPLEVLDSIRQLLDLLDAYAASVTDYERARFRLLVALGIPPRGFLDPSALPTPPPPAEAPGTLPPPQALPAPAAP